MELKQPKPIHIRCPKCGYDISCNANHIVEELQAEKARHKAIDAKIAKAKADGFTKASTRYKELIVQRAECEQRITALKRARQNLTENAELEKYKVFAKLVRSKYGAEVTKQMLIEAEDTLVYNDYDMAIQKSTNFDGV